MAAPGSSLEGVLLSVLEGRGVTVTGERDSAGCFSPLGGTVAQALTSTLKTSMLARRHTLTPSGGHLTERFLPRHDHRLFYIVPARHEKKKLHLVETHAVPMVEPLYSLDTFIVDKGAIGAALID